MKYTDQYDPSDMLDHVKRVDAPPFLLTRIRQKIDTARRQASPALIWATGLSMALIFTVNIYVITAPAKTNDVNPGNELAQSMNLYPHNSLYE